MVSLGICLGLWTVALHHVGNLPDADQDREHRVSTLVTRLGFLRARLLVPVFYLVAWLSFLPAVAAADDVAPPKFTAKDLVAPAAGHWITNGGNLYNQRYSTLALINKDNVARLKPAWRTHLNGSGLGAQFSGQAQPIVHEGVEVVGDRAVHDSVNSSQGSF